MLQNDMGNTMIQDSATGAVMQLSPGFVPVGMKENGGILYIVSANKEGQSEIGTIPSPIITWDYIDISNIGTESVIADDANNFDVKIISENLYSGEEFLVVLNLECEDAPFTNGIYTIDLPDYDPIKSLSSTVLTKTNAIHPLISTINQKGFYTIDLYSCNAQQKKIIQQKEQQQFYLMHDSEIHISDYWFIPYELIKDQGDINLTYTKLENKLLKYSSDYNSGKLGIKTSLENISDFTLVKRAGGIASDQKESYLPYTYIYKNSKGEATYYTYFSSFSYKSSSSVRVAKLKVNVHNDTTNKNITVYTYKRSSTEYVPSTEGSCDVLIWDDGALQNTKILSSTDQSETSTNIISNIIGGDFNNVIFSTFNYEKDIFYIQKKILTKDQFDKGTNTHTSKDSAKDHEGLFYIRYNTKEEYNSWYTLTVDYYDQIDRKLGTYTLKFNPFYNDYIGDGVDTIERETPKKQNNITSFIDSNYKVNTLFEGECIQKANASQSVTAYFTKLDNRNCSYLSTASMTGKFDSNITLSSVEAYVPLSARYKWTTGNSDDIVKIGISIVPSDSLFSKDYKSYSRNESYHFESFDSDIPAGSYGKMKLKTFNGFGYSFVSHRACTLTKSKKSDNKFEGLVPVIILDNNKDNDDVILFGDESSTITFSQNFTTKAPQTSDFITFTIEATDKTGGDDFWGVFVGSDIKELPVYNGGLNTYTYHPKPLSIVGKIQGGTASVIYTFPEDCSFNSIITQFNHYYNYTDRDTAEVKIVPGNVGTINGKVAPYQHNLMMEDGEIKNYASINNNERNAIKSSSIATLQQNILPHPVHSVPLSLYVDKQIFSNWSLTYIKPFSTIDFKPLVEGVYVLNFYGYSLSNDWNGSIYLNVNSKPFEFLSGQPVLIKIRQTDKIDYSTTQAPGHFGFLSFGLYRIDTQKLPNIFDELPSVDKITGNSFITVKDYNASKSELKDKVVMPLSETYYEKITCLNVDFDYAYCPEEAYQTTIDLDGNTCHYTIEEDTSKAILVSNYAFHIPEDTKIR